MTTPTFTHVTLLFFLYSDELSRHVKSQPVHFFKYFSFIYWLIMLMLGAWIVIGWGLKGGGCSKSLDISEWLIFFFFPFSVLMSVWHQKIYINILYVAWIVWLHSIYFVLSFGWLVLEDWKHVSKKKKSSRLSLNDISVYLFLSIVNNYRSWWSRVRLDWAFQNQSTRSFFSFFAQTQQKVQLV